jgi:hypothetical protein
MSWRRRSVPRPRRCCVCRTPHSLNCEEGKDGRQGRAYGGDRCSQRRPSAGPAAELLWRGLTVSARALSVKRSRCTSLSRSRPARPDTGVCRS